MFFTFLFYWIERKKHHFFRKKFGKVLQDLKKALPLHRNRERKQR